MEETTISFFLDAKDTSRCYTWIIKEKKKEERNMHVKKQKEILRNYTMFQAGLVVSFIDSGPFSI